MHFILLLLQMIDAKIFNELLKKIYYDPEARELFFKNYYELIKSRVKWKLGNRSEWEDVAHDVVRKLLETDWTDYPYVNFPVGWLNAIADNSAKDLFRQTNKIVQIIEDSAEEFNLNTALVEMELKEKLGKFPKDVQYIIHAHFIEGYTYLEISKILGISHENVRVKASRTLKKLKTSLNLTFKG